jgi:NifU-like protein involved in Fe-S cluster formation
MQFSHEVEQMVCVKNCASHGCAPIPQEGKWTKAKEIKDLNGLTHGVGWCAPQQGTCKLTLNIKGGIVRESLIETVGCSGMTHSAAMAAESIVGKTVLECLNTDLVCDAINVAMRELALQIFYGRSQSAFSEDGLPIGAGLEDLGKGLRSQVGTVFSTEEKGVRYLETAEGYITQMGLDKNGEVIGYEFVRIGAMMELITQKGMDAAEALKKCTGVYGRFNEAITKINPRTS